MFNKQKKKIRSRSWFKLDEIQQIDKILSPGITVLDLGSSPGGWSQYAITKVGITGHIIACDILDMPLITGVSFIKGDFSNILVQKKIITFLHQNKVQTILSDMAPNMTGCSLIDTTKSIYLMELALNMCFNVLSPGGSFLVKGFHSEDCNKFLRKISLYFTNIKTRKPHASRSRSREIYIVAKGYKL